MQTAVLREVLTREAYHVLHFDLRLPGFADISSLYMSLSQQMEQFFQEIGKQLPGYEEFKKESWSFKVSSAMSRRYHLLMERVRIARPFGCREANLRWCRHADRTCKDL